MTDERRRWLDEPRNVRRVALAVYVVCGLLLAADLLLARTAHFSFENWFGFYGIFGFVVSFSLVLTAKQLRRLLRRDEDFYERQEQAPDDQ